MDQSNQEAARLRLHAKTARLNRRNDIWKRDGGRCYYCSRPLSRKTMTLDHVIPRSRNGSDNDSNVVLCCRYCNGEKGGLSMEEFRKKLRWTLSGMPAFNQSQVLWIKRNLGEDIAPKRALFWFERRKKGMKPIFADHLPDDITVSRSHLYQEELA